MFLKGTKKLPVAMRLGETPVHIPNTMVKTQAAHGTMLETAWESRWLPDSLKKKAGRQLLYIDTDISEWDVKSLREKMC